VKRTGLTPGQFEDGFNGSVQRELAPDQQALRAVNRRTFGPRPGEVDRVRAMGVDRWIDQQLRADTTVLWAADP